ncbi:hypothetical protein VTK56DRAFT_4214 [Thermocarpiscus australiensis]
MLKVLSEYQVPLVESTRFRTERTACTIAQVLRANANTLASKSSSGFSRNRHRPFPIWTGANSGSERPLNLELAIAPAFWATALGELALCLKL